MNRQHGISDLIHICVPLILVLVILYSGLQILESTVFYAEEPEPVRASGKTVFYHGEAYYPRQDITTVLILGIDQTGPVTDSGFFRNRGAADMAALLIADEKNEEIRVLCLNRDTMLEMPVLGVGGKPAGTTVAQLAMAHTYGSGLEDSCENTKAAVSRFLKGIRIDYYISMNMDAIAIANDAVGGVTVTVTEDFSSVDPSIGTGPVTLKGQQAHHYVRTRAGVGDQLNLSRMERQKQYITAFLEAFRGAQAGQENYALSVYESLAPYIVSDLPVNTFTGMLNRYEAYPLAEIAAVEGDNVLGDTYYEFYPHREALDELIIRLFFAKK